MESRESVEVEELQQGKTRAVKRLTNSTEEKR
jgi:hypothetical protein